MKVAIILLARIGSKRIPKKLVKSFCGKPLIEYTLEFMSKLNFDKYVFTDGEEIKKICEKYNVIVRKKHYENKSGIHKTQKELKKYNKKIKADIIILLQGTSPLRNYNKFCGYLSRFLNSDFDVAFSVNRIEKIIYNENAERINKKRTYNEKENFYMENGSYYFFKKEQINKDHITDGNRMLIEDEYDIDIDTFDDWKKAELLYKGGYYVNN